MDLIENQGGLVAIGYGAAFLKKAAGTFVNAAFTEDRFKDDGAGAVVDGSVQGGNIIPRDKLYLFEQRLETFAVFVLPGERHGAKGSSVIRTFESHQLALGLASHAMTCQAGEFDGSLDGLGAAIREKSAVQTGKLAELLGQSSLKLVVVEIGKVDGASRLLANCFDHPGMSMAKSVDPESGDEIQVAIPFPVEQINSLAALEGDGIAVVGGQQKTAFAFNDFFGDGHMGKRRFYRSLGLGSCQGKTHEPLRARSITKVFTQGFLRAPS